jgi:hypothetical protein
MPNTAQIDLAEGQEPLPGETFIISLQENSEMLGVLDKGRTFRFTAPTKPEQVYQQEKSILTVVDFDPINAGSEGRRRTGYLTYTAEVANSGVNPPRIDVDLLFGPRQWYTRSPSVEPKNIINTVSLAMTFPQSPPRAP